MVAKAARGYTEWAVEKQPETVPELSLSASIAKAVQLLRSFCS
jgi:hypothetical protein